MKLSIITVCFNNKDGLIKTIDSVRNQTFKDYEFIVIDGGSTDGSKEVIEQNKELFSFWCSEPDGGIYQGMNKGIDHATGEYCLFLNSGDWLANSKVLQRVFDKEFDEDILYGNIIRVKGHQKKFYKYPKELTFYDFYKTSAAIHHQASFIKRLLFCKYGNYAEDTYMNADWRFFFKTVVKNDVSTRHVECLISVCDASGVSSIHNKNPKELADLDFKHKQIKESLPALAIKDYVILNKQNCACKLFVQLIYRLSILIPISIFTICHE